MGLFVYSTYTKRVAVGGFDGNEGAFLQPEKEISRRLDQVSQAWGNTQIIYFSISLSLKSLQSDG